VRQCLLLKITIIAIFSNPLPIAWLPSSPGQNSLVNSLSPLSLSSHFEQAPVFFLKLTKEVGLPLTDFGIPAAQATTSETRQQENSVYENPSHGFSIEYPSDWRVDEGNASGTGVIAVFTSPLESDFDTFAENLAIGVQSLPNGTSLEDYGRSAVALLQSEPGFELIRNATATTFGDLPAQEIEYTLEIPNESEVSTTNTMTIQGLQVWTIREGSAYVLSFASEQDEFSANFSDIEQVIGTFRLTNTEE
jgi:hypothetical protein